MNHHPAPTARTSSRRSVRLLGAAAFALTAPLAAGCTADDTDDPPAPNEQTTSTVPPAPTGSTSPVEGSDPDGGVDPGGEGRPDIEPQPAPDTDTPIGPDTGTDVAN